jgi:hypothetical protein
MKFYFGVRLEVKQGLMRQSLYELNPEAHPLPYFDKYLLNVFCRNHGVFMVNDKAIVEDRILNTYTLVGFKEDVAWVLAIWNSYTKKRLLYRAVFRKRLSRYRLFYSRRDNGLSEESLEEIEQFKEKRSLFFRILVSIYIEFSFKILENCQKVIEKQSPKLEELGEKLEITQFVKLKRNPKSQKPNWRAFIGKKYRNIYWATPINPFEHEKLYFKGGNRKIPVFDFLPPKNPNPAKGRGKRKNSKRISKAREYLRKIRQRDFSD